MLNKKNILAPVSLLSWRTTYYHYLYPSPSITVSPEQNLNAQNSATYEDSVSRKRITECFAIISRLLSTVISLHVKYVRGYSENLPSALRRPRAQIGCPCCKVRGRITATKPCRTSRRIESDAFMYYVPQFARAPHPSQRHALRTQAWNPVKYFIYL